VLIRTCERLHACGTSAYIVNDLSGAQISVPIGGAGVEGVVVLDGATVRLDSARAIVVSELATGLPGPLRPEDVFYVREEIRASWLGLLASVQCMVVNRPGVWQAIVNEPWQVRAFVRRRGIPTVEEEVASARSLVRVNGRPRAAMDLGNGETFWLTEESTLPHDGTYSVTDVRTGARYAVVVKVLRHVRTFVFDAAQNHLRADALLGAPLVEWAEALLAPLGIDYGYCVFAVADDRFAFTRLFASPPAFLQDRLDEQIAELLFSELTA
jgi:hypothetical protein